MSTSFAVPAPRSAMLLRRRIAAYFVGGAGEVPALVGALEGRRVHELSVDIKDGVRESSMVCAVLLATDETEALLDRLRTLPAVVSAELG
ncbi:hypothetical protein [Amycolatopsis vancoresmycina]|uniref:ACT domain-containing protein n=1 Tax=Amycolatopsis vancoresmycina DSM 44592 TaxID=1292037 RepID=R1GDG5_9PSEU|nr:hypothetical protein [Amycolatopsis vancoresmycina]EOD69362.1 hypothetical protein H480_06548 [Amycolatopsis vancoresmycina DSM 44592]